MILGISDTNFKKILNDEQLFLPIQWDGIDFLFDFKIIIRQLH